MLLLLTAIKHVDSKIIQKKHPFSIYLFIHSTHIYWVLLARHGTELLGYREGYKRKFPPLREDIIMTGDRQTKNRYKRITKTSSDRDQCPEKIMRPYNASKWLGVGTVGSRKVGTGFLMKRNANLSDSEAGYRGCFIHLSPADHLLPFH